MYKFITSTAVVLALAGLSAAQSLSNVPACAGPCVTKLLPSSCNLDPKCICGDPNFISNVACCVSTACDKAGQDAALSFAQQICTSSGTNSTLPAEASCNNSTSSANSSSADSSSTATTTGSAATSATSAAGAASSSAAASAAGQGVVARGVGWGMGVGLLGLAALL